MAITITTEANVAITPGLNVEIVNALVARKSLNFQLQAEGIAWVRLGGAAAKNVGIRVRGWQLVTIDASFAGPGNGTDFYEGAVNVFWEGGGVDPATNAPLTTANVRVIEAS